MSRILLLHASVGMGHQRAAMALAQAFEQSPGTSVLVENTLQHARSFFRRSYAGLYLGIADWVPGFWSFFYAQTDRPPVPAGERPGGGQGRRPDGERGAGTWSTSHYRNAGAWAGTVERGLCDTLLGLKPRSFFMHPCVVGAPSSRGVAATRLRP